LTSLAVRDQESFWKEEAMVRKLLRRLHQDQRGFTLIELLVVITVLGVLAAIVSISVLGVTSTARENAKKAELQTVQTAFDAMLHDQLVTRGDIGAGCTDGTSKPPPPPDPHWTKTMTNFPIGSKDNNKGKGYDGPGKGIVAPLATFYLRQAETANLYACDKNGNVYQP